MPIDLLIDGQFGSTGKGKLADFLMNGRKRNIYGIAACNFGSNAGHTIVVDGKKKVFRQLPVAAAIPDFPCHIGPGAIIDPEVLGAEIDEHNCRESLTIHPSAVVIEDWHKLAEQDLTKVIGSTMKGCGAALSDKIMRKAKLAKSVGIWREFITFPHFLTDHLRNDSMVLGETAQGFALSIDGPFYPHCTSRNINVPAALDQLGHIHPSFLRNVYMTFRTYPIRVGHVIEAGKEVGNSGPVYADTKEITFDSIGVRPETTTVTGRVRRVFTWSDQMFLDAIYMNHPTDLFFNFVNYINPEDGGCNDWMKLSQQTKVWLMDKLILAHNHLGMTFNNIFIGTGPDRLDMVQVPARMVYDV